MGAFVSTHGKSIDDVDRSIVEARTSLNEVTQELQERVHRWKQIELLCGFNIVNNSGLQFLENTLYRGLNGRGLRGMSINLGSKTYKNRNFFCRSKRWSCWNTFGSGTFQNSKLKFCINFPFLFCLGRMSSTDDLDDETSSLYMSHTGKGPSFDDDSSDWLRIVAHLGHHLILPSLA